MKSIDRRFFLYRIAVVGLCIGLLILTIDNIQTHQKLATVRADIQNNADRMRLAEFNLDRTREDIGAENKELKDELERAGKQSDRLHSDLDEAQNTVIVEEEYDDKTGISHSPSFNEIKNLLLVTKPYHTKIRVINSELSDSQEKELSALGKDRIRFEIEGC